MSSMWQARKKIHLASSWEDIPFMPLMRLTGIPSVIAGVIIGVFYYLYITQIHLSDTWYIIALVILYTVLAQGVQLYYYSVLEGTRNQLFVVMLVTGALTGVFVAIAKLITNYYALALFRLISEPILAAFAFMILGMIARLWRQGLPSE